MHGPQEGFEMSSKNIPANVKALWRQACKARLKAYAPYSRFRVGAALESGGQIYSACNIENAVYNSGICAERVALWKAMSEGRRPEAHLVIVVQSKLPTPPCGSCLQVMSELGSSNLRIWMASPKRIFGSQLLSELLPSAYNKKILRSGQE